MILVLVTRRSSSNPQSLILLVASVTRLLADIIPVSYCGSRLPEGRTSSSPCRRVRIVGYSTYHWLRLLCSTVIRRWLDLCWGLG
ncbi:hypothetical protein HOY82DRAFT_581506 [Tuber indicum]|nr:hypothetical protein HOY82DRAFT_581506 [Tuber indicum]